MTSDTIVILQAYITLSKGSILHRNFIVFDSVPVSKRFNFVSIGEFIKKKRLDSA